VSTDLTGDRVGSGKAGCESNDCTLSLLLEKRRSEWAKLDDTNNPQGHSRPNAKSKHSTLRGSDNVLRRTSPVIPWTDRQKQGGYRKRCDADAPPRIKRKTLLLSSIMMTILSPNLYPSSALCAQYAVPHLCLSRPTPKNKTRSDM